MCMRDVFGTVAYRALPGARKRCPVKRRALHFTRHGTARKPVVSGVHERPRKQGVAILPRLRRLRQRLNPPYPVGRC
jgi:hypothetical protein